MTNKEFFISSWERQAKVLVKGIRSLPTDTGKLAQKHHPKFRSPWELVNHVGPHAKEMWQAASEGRMDLVNEGKFDLTSTTIYKNLEEAAKAVEEYSAKLLEQLKKCDDATWDSRVVPVFWGPMKIMEFPLSQCCWMMLFDTVYHIGQLTSYYRVIGAEQPNLMGPTLEEEEAMMAKN